MASPRYSWWCRLVWCSAARLDARNKGERSGIAIVVIVIAVAFDIFKGKPKVRHVQLVSLMVLDVFSSWE